MIESNVAIHLGCKKFRKEERVGYLVVEVCCYISVTPPLPGSSESLLKGISATGVGMG